MRDRRRQVAVTEWVIAACFFLLTALSFAPGAETSADRVMDALLSSVRRQRSFSLGGAEATTAQTETIPSETRTSDETGTATAGQTPYKTPADVLRMQAEASETHRGSAAVALIKEQDFSDAGVTDLVKNVAIKNGTETKTPDYSALLAEGPVLSAQRGNAPLVLIFHTHTTESYLLTDDGSVYENDDTRSEDPARNMVRVGDMICEALEAEGISVIHDTAIYDAAYNGAYARSREMVEATLKKYPSIQIVLDVHRDAIRDSDTVVWKPAARINGKKAAQIMIITGAEEGSVTAFPKWEENLRFALCLQRQAQSMFEGLMRPLYFCPRKYNMDVTPCGLLLEVGSDANTLDEALYAGSLMGRALAAVIKAYT